MIFFLSWGLNKKKWIFLQKNVSTDIVLVLTVIAQLKLFWFRGQGGNNIIFHYLSCFD